MTNAAIADNFSLLSKLMDIHGDNSFKAKAYAAASFTVDKLPAELATLSPEKIFSIKGIGEATGKKILEQLQTGRLKQLDEYIERTPQGIMQMLYIKGLGPKKIATIWKELEVESIGELLYACNENRLLLYKGFGAKTQQSIKESIEFFLNHQGNYLYAQVERFAEEFEEKLQSEFPSNQFLLTGNMRRQSLVIDRIEWVTDLDVDELEKFFAALNYTTETTDISVTARGAENVTIILYHTTAGLLYNKLFLTSAADEFLSEWKQRFGFDEQHPYKNEEAIFEANRISFIPAYQRETAEIIEKAGKAPLANVIIPADIKGIIHSHSTWSDGINSLDEMAAEAIRIGLEYLVISDHSKSAYYAKGLYPERIIAQHELIDELNLKLDPFRIFKSIESDILNDGSLDYDDDVLSSFDMVIASIHSNFKMSEEKATSRLIKAIENPFTTIVGHMTGRLLLSRNGYPVDTAAVIDACAKNNVVIELNAHPRRLDMDWKWIDKAVEKGVLISIDPDAHSAEAFAHTKYGVLAAQKGGLTKANNLSSFSLSELKEFLKKQKLKRGE